MALRTFIWSRVLAVVVGALGLVIQHDASATPAPGGKEAELQARIDQARERLIKELGASPTAETQSRKIAQWYNWPNWGNWYNGWRNY